MILQFAEIKHLLGNFWAWVKALRTQVNKIGSSLGPVFFRLKRASLLILTVVVVVIAGIWIWFSDSLSITDKLNSTYILVTFCILLAAVLQRRIESILTFPLFKVVHEDGPVYSHVTYFEASSISEGEFKREESVRLATVRTSNPPSTHESVQVRIGYGIPQYGTGSAYSVHQHFVAPQGSSTLAKVPVCASGNMTVDTGKVAYYRIKIVNTGNCTGNNVRVMICGLEVYKGGKYEAVEEFFPMTLMWSHVQSDIVQSLPPRMGWHVDLGYILHPDDAHTIIKRDGGRVFLILEMLVKPLNQWNVLDPGQYKLRLRVFSDNADTVECDIQLIIGDSWIEDAKQMCKLNIE